MFIADEAAMLGLGERLGHGLAGQTGVIFFCGDLGAGKTTLVRGLLHGLGHRGTVKSPTYTLIEPYQLVDVIAYHVDLYRLNHPEELEFTGLRDSFGEAALFLVEWPERGRSVLPAPDIEVYIGRKPQGRSVSLAAGSPTGRRLLGSL